MGQTARKGFVRVEHFFHTGENIYIEHAGTQLVEGQVDAGYTGDAVPVETRFLPATGGKSDHFIGFSGQDLHTAVCQVAAVEVGRQVVFGSPEVAGMSAYYGRPVVTALYGHAAVTQCQVALRVGFGTEALCFEQALHLHFMTGRSFRKIFGSILSRRFVIGNQAQVGGSHIRVVLLLAVRSSGNGHRGILDRNQFAPAVGMTAGHGERPLLQVAVEAHGE